MQLKFKKICLVSTLIVYCASFLIQSNFGLFEVVAKERNVPRVNIVAILVDDKIYSGISGGLSWYASDYVQQKLSDTKALVIPLDLTDIHAYDIFRMMQNIYFDGLENVNSQLIGLVMFGDIPLPVVNQYGYIFPTVYPYVDFENPKYVWDSENQYFIPNNNPEGQAEVWHGLINYGTDISAYNKFFEKIESYVSDPDEFIGDSIWYDDFIAQKEGFIDENFPYYRNRIMFAEDLGYQRHTPLMRKIYRGEENESAIDIVSNLEELGGVTFEGRELAEKIVGDSVNKLRSTKMVQQEIETSFISDYNELFSKESVSTMRENVFAGGRWIKKYEMDDKIYEYNWLKDYDREMEKRLMADVDGSASKLQLKDDILLGNEDLQGLLENLNELMEEVVDKKVDEKHLSMDIAIPVEYQVITKIPVINCGCWYFKERFDNYYFGRNARMINKAEELSIYRGTYRNLSDLAGVTYDTLLEGNNPIKTKYEDTNIRFKSIGGSYDIFSVQSEGNRGYSMFRVDGDADLYDAERRVKDYELDHVCGPIYERVWPHCDDDEDDECEDLYWFSKRWRGSATPVTLLPESVAQGRYQSKDYLATDAWNWIFDQGGFQSLPEGDDEGFGGKGWQDGKGVGPQWAAVSYRAFAKYGSPTQVLYWTPAYQIWKNQTPNVHIPFSDVDYYKLSPDIVKWENIKEEDYTDDFFILFYDDNQCPGKQIKYVNKVINSIVKHDSTNLAQFNGTGRTFMKFHECEKYGQKYMSNGIDCTQFGEEYMSGMNILSSDRPIDSPRYTIMNSVAGDEMKFIYPDLFKVEVYKFKRKNKSGYDVHELLTGGQIKENLVKYLKGKVKEYNDIVEDHCSRAIDPGEIHFARLKEMGYLLATPDKSIHGCGRPFVYEEFVEALGGEKKLDVIAEVLYYNSLTNKKKLSSKAVKKDIELIRQSFSLNYKREQILKDYLTEGNEKIKDIVFEIPTYQKTGYEVAYVNSDGRDYIFPSEKVAEDYVEEFDQSVLDPTSDSYNIDRNQLTDYEQELEDECQIPSNGKVPLFRINGTSPWLEKFKCWWQKTLKDPIKIKLKFENSLGELLYDDTLEGDVKEAEVEDYNARGELKCKYGGGSCGKSNNGKDGYTTDELISELQTEAEEHNKKVTAGESGLAKTLSNINNNCKCGNSNVSLTDNNPTSNLRIESPVDVGDVELRITSTGDGCIQVNSTALCSGASLTGIFNPKTNPFVGIVESADRVAGTVGLIIQMYTGGECIENVIKYTVAPGQNNSDWGELKSRYADKWDELVEGGAGYDADKTITEMQVKSRKHNSEVTSGTSGLANLLSSINKNIRISNTNVLLSDNNPESILRIESLVDNGNVNVTLSLFGDGCIQVDSNKLCNGDTLSIPSFNPKTNPYSGVVKSADHVAGKVGLIIQIGAGGGYIENIIKYTVSPSLLKYFTITLADNKTVAGMLTPVSVVGYDKYDNVVDRGLEKYDFTVSQGRFLKDGAYQESFSTNDFKNLKFYYQAPLDPKEPSEGVIQISKTKDPSAISGTYRQTIVKANPVIKLEDGNGTVVIQGRTNLSADAKYTLKSEENFYVKGKVSIPNLKKIEVEIRDDGGNLVDINSQVLVTSQNGLVVVGQVNKQENGEEEFFETSKINIAGGRATAYYYLTTVAGNDVINVDIPGLPTRIFNYRINPAPTQEVQLDITKEYVKEKGETDFEIFTSDRWGNPTSTQIVVTADPRYVDFDLPKLTSCDIEDDEFCDYLATVTDGYLKTKIKGIKAGLTDVTTDMGAYIQFKVDKNIFPETGLNIMYLNYFGSDRGNQWGYFSDNDNYVEYMMKESNKIITTTTQLVTESKIKKLLWKIEPGFQISNLEGVDTVMTMESGKMYIIVGGVGKMNSKVQQFTWLQVTGNIINENLAKNPNKNFAFFSPSDPKYEINNGVLYSSGERVGNILNGEITLQLSNEFLDNGDNVWTVINRGVNYGDLVFHYPSFMPNVADFGNPGERYLVGPVFSKGSTDSLSSVGVFDGLSDFELESNYKSIQDSDEIDEKVGFLGHFKNITLFGEGEIVGEATKVYGSEFLINLGDPVLSRKDVNDMVHGTDYDGGIGQEIYVDSESDIFRAFPIDFNNDGLKDWIIFYYDGSVKLAKNYGGRPDLRNMQELIRIAVHIKEAYVGDADGNGYEDILVLTDNNQIRAYLNNGGKFDSDGSVACLNQNVFGGQISKTPTSLDGVIQLFVDDMNVDGKVDIITYDKVGYVKIFYGGSTKSGPNYLSNLKYACDTGWYEREAPNIHITTSFGIQVGGHDVRDNAMMHWVGIARPEIKEAAPLSEYGVFFDPSTIQSLVKPRERDSDGDLSAALVEIMDKDKFDVDFMDEKYKNISAKYVDTTLYENILQGGETVTDQGHNYLFAPISFIDPDPLNCEDPCKVHKNFSVKKGGQLLMDGDIVTVKVTIKAGALCSCVGAFGDIIQGPWNVYYDENEIIEHFRPGINWRNAVLKKRDGNFAYLVDNVNLGPGEYMNFEYDLEYHHVPAKKLSITYDTFYGAGPDLKVQSVDGCVKDFDVYHNGVSYENIPLQSMINDEYLAGDEMSEDYAEDVMSYGSNVNELPGIVGDTVNRLQLLLQGGKVDMGAFGVKTDELEEIVDDITKGMCNGFSFGGSSNCKGLPVPFNQAFLAPGKYHLFGCWELPVGPLEKGLPMFNFPGTMYVAGVPVPIPWGLKGPTDGFIWAPGGTYNSFIRIYAAPTLTAQLGIAVCMGDYSVGYALQSPWSDLGGNCVVFAVKPQCEDKQEHDKNKKKDRDNPNAVYEKYVDAVRDSGVCIQSTKGPYGEYTPFVLYNFSSTFIKEISKDPIQSARDWFEKNVDVGGGSNYQVDYYLKPLSLIQLEITSYAGPDDDTDNDKNQIFIGDVDVLGGDYDVNKIKGGIRQGIRKILIDNWLDPQIRYIVNHLTKMHVNVKLPDLSNVISNEVETMRNVSQNIDNIWKNDDEQVYSKVDTGIAAKVGWAYINQDNLNKFNKSISNPFEGLANLMNESNIINISTEPITVKIPMIFAEDINAYELYLQQWLEVNQAIVNRWKSVLSDAEFDAKLGGWQKIQSQIYSNIMTLQEYRNFPFEIYEWIHVIDRYMSEIASLINDTIGYLSFWTSTNSERFVGYVDAIILILNIIKTYQVLIDFSIEWGQNCGNCSRDTYDQYTCKLSLLCDGIKLPIIQIPNFKLPNITIDLTNIDLGLDIILPDFNFQPVRIDLPDIPNLPEPPSVAVNVDINLPDIPLLPEPPELPELPSFIPEVELELPILPPAPELPEFPSAIEKILKIARVIGKIFCIVKGQFGLVGESSVKAKIEQLTQRTYEVKWIDAIMDFTNFSIAPIHHYGIDYEIYSDVDLQFDFTAFYDYLDTLTKSINNLSTSSVNWMNRETNSLVNDNPLMGVRDAIDGVNVDANVKIGMADISNSDVFYEGLLSDEIKYVDYDRAKSRLKEVLSFFRSETRDTALGDTISASIDKIERQVDKPNLVEPNIKGIENMEKQILTYLDNKKSSYYELEKLINEDYNGFLAMVDSQSSDNNVKKETDEDKLLTFNLKLFDVDSSTRDSINMITKSNPYETLIENKKNIIDGYWNAITSSSADDLGLTESQYLVLRNNIGTAENRISSLYSITKPVSSTQLVAKNSVSTVDKTLVASAGGESRLGSNMEVAEVIDPSLFSQGIYEKILYGADAGKLTKIIFADSFASVMLERHYHSPHGRGHNIVLYDEEAVYLKCPGGECNVGGGGHSKYYYSQTLKQIPYKKYILEFDSDTRLKIADVKEEVRNWKSIGQSFDYLTLSWDLGGDDAYLIKLVERIDHSYEKSDYNSTEPVIYVLAVPDDIDQDKLYKTKLELLKKIDTVENLEGDKKDLVQVVYYDNYKPGASVSISNVDRKWYYARIARLNIDKDNIYRIESPWSNQVVIGKQILGDQQAPDGDPILYRPSVPEVVSEGDDLEGYVGTRYELIVNWVDNVALSYINISKDGKILDEKYTSEIEDQVITKIDIHTKEEKEKYNTIGIDQFGNKTEKVITVNYSIPAITITDVSKNSDGNTLTIVAELSQDIDQGNVSFQRRRGSVWKTMKRVGNSCGDISIGQGDWKVIGSPYTAGNEIAMYDKDGSVMALMDPDTAEIKLQDGYDENYEVKTVVQNNCTLKVCNKNTGGSVFSISIPTEECLKVEAEGYKVDDLNGKMGMFNGGKVVHQGGKNVLYISPTGYLYSESGLEGSYDYDRELEAVVVTLFQTSDLKKQYPIKVWLKVKPFIQD